MNKQEMVDCLVTHALQTRSAEPAHDGSRQRRPKTCPDFAKMSERLLERELQFRGLLDFDEPDLVDDNEDGMSGDDLRVLLAGSLRPCLDNHFFD